MEVYNCPFCDFATSDKDEMLHHVKIHEGNPDNEIIMRDHKRLIDEVKECLNDPAASYISKINAVISFEIYHNIPLPLRLRFSDVVVNESTTCTFCDGTGKYNEKR